MTRSLACGAVLIMMAMALTATVMMPSAASAEQSVHAHRASAAHAHREHSNPSVRRHDREAPAAHVAPSEPHGDDVPSMSDADDTNVMPTADTSPSNTAASQCSGSPYDFSTQNYCGAETLSGATYQPPTNPPNINLVLDTLQLITRHGDRTPVNFLPSYDVAFNFCQGTQTIGFAGRMPTPLGDAPNEGRRLEQQPFLAAPSVSNPYASVLWQGSCATGQLTSLGQQQHATAGDGFRQVYVNKWGFLPGSYFRKNTSFYLRSTDVWRTKQSAEAFLSGLWPTLALENQDIIPVHTYPAEIETMYANGGACPAITAVQAAQQKEDAWVAHLAHPQVWEALDRIGGVGGLPAWHASYDHWFDNLRARQCNNLPLPCNPANSTDCLPQEMADFIYAQGDWEYRYLQNESPLASKLAAIGISGFMATLRDHLRARITGKADVSAVGTPQFAYFSGHDTTLSAVLGALNVTGMVWPPYASQFIVELFRDESKPSPSGAASDYYARVLYNSQVLRLFAAGCCDDLCPADKLLTYLDSIIPADVAKQCADSRAKLQQGETR